MMCIASFAINSDRLCVSQETKHIDGMASLRKHIAATFYRIIRPAIIWPALLARIGVAADWRGTRRLIAFTTEASSGQRIQLSGGWTVYRRRAGFEVRRDAAAER